MTVEESVDLIDNRHMAAFIQPCVWADLGAGSGIFTQALLRLLPVNSTIYAVDKSGSVGNSAMNSNDRVQRVEADFEHDELNLNNLDGILMANALHYVKNKREFIKRSKSWLKANGSFLIVEYDTDKPVSTWVPYPISFASLIKLFQESGYHSIEKIGERPSIYSTGTMYAAWIE